jgi:hypothetical protein
MVSRSEDRHQKFRTNVLEKIPDLPSGNGAALQQGIAISDGQCASS